MTAAFLASKDPSGAAVQRRVTDLRGSGFSFLPGPPTPEGRHRDGQRPLDSPMFDQDGVMHELLLVDLHPQPAR